MGSSTSTCCGGARGIFISWASFWFLLLLILPCLLRVFHRLLGCFLTETGLDQEGLESFLFLFPLDLKAVIAVVCRPTTMLTLNEYEKVTTMSFFGFLIQAQPPPKSLSLMLGLT